MNPSAIETSPSTSQAEAASDAAPRARARRAATLDFVGRYGMLVVFGFMLLVFLATNDSFRQPDNLLNILQQNSMIGIVACGMAVMIIAGGFDLSVGATGAAASVAAASVMVHSGSITLGVLAGLGVGFAVGALNGLLIAKLNITPLVTTLGTTSLITGIMLTATSALPVAGIPASFSHLGLGKIAGIPVPAIVFAAVAFVTWAGLRKTRVGHYVYAHGSNREASRLAGVPVDRVFATTFIVGGLFAGIAGLIMLGQTTIGQPSAATDWPLTAIAAVVVGGTPLRGGLGGVHSAVIGTLLLGVVANAITLYGVSPYLQPAVTGVVILIAVGVDSYQRRNRGGDS